MIIKIQKQKNIQKRKTKIKADQGLRLNLTPDVLQSPHSLRNSAWKLKFYFSFEFNLSCGVFISFFILSLVCFHVFMLDFIVLFY